MNFSHKSQDRRAEREDVLKLVSRKNKIKNYVRAVSYDNIPISFKSTHDPEEGSYSNGHGIVIDADLECDNDDHIIGHALHQAACILKTDFGFLSDFREYPKYYIPDEIWDYAKSYHMDEELIHFIVLIIGNIIENKRLDKWIYNEAPGYRKYIDAMYKKMYHSDQVLNAFREKKYAGNENIPTYLFYTMHVGNGVVDSSDLYGIDEIFNIIDIDNIDRFSGRQHVHHAACKVFEVIIRSCDDIENVDFKEFRSLLKNSMNGLMDDTVKFLMDEISMDAVGHRLMSGVEVFENPNIQDIEFKAEGLDAEVRCLFVKEITASMLKNNEYGNLMENIQTDSLEGVERGELLGMQLREKLQIRNDEHVEKRTRKKSGEIDPANLSEIGYNDEIFMETTTDKYNQLNVHISIDASGSMSGTKWVNSICSAVALAKAMEGVSNAEIQISFRTTSYMSEHGVDAAVLMGYDSRVNSFDHIRNVFPHIGPSGSTPEGLCYEATMDYILTVSGDDNLFINYSDGMPQTYIDGASYTGDVAVTHTSRQVKKMKESRIKVLSYFIGNSNTFGGVDGGSSSAFFKMYGENSKFVNPTDMSSVAQTLNDKFLEKKRNE